MQEIVLLFDELAIRFFEYGNPLFSFNLHQLTLIGELSSVAISYPQELIIVYGHLEEVIIAGAIVQLDFHSLGFPLVG